MMTQSEFYFTNEFLIVWRENSLFICCHMQCQQSDSGCGSTKQERATTENDLILCKRRGPNHPLLSLQISGKLRYFSIFHKHIHTHAPDEINERNECYKWSGPHLNTFVALPPMLSTLNSHFVIFVSVLFIYWKKKQERVHDVIMVLYFINRTHKFRWLGLVCMHCARNVCRFVVVRYNVVQCFWIDINYSLTK